MMEYPGNDSLNATSFGRFMTDHVDYMAMWSRRPAFVVYDPVAGYSRVCCGGGIPRSLHMVM